jgi:hypothetical protein
MLSVVQNFERKKNNLTKQKYILLLKLSRYVYKTVCKKIFKTITLFIV